MLGFNLILLLLSTKDKYKPVLNSNIILVTSVIFTVSLLGADQIGSAGGYLHNQLPILIVLILSLQTVFRQNRHEDVLDLACVQFEPDSADYIRVSCGHNLSRHVIT